ncbi:MAG: hypothetical protein HY784_12540, partial [Chloroflexi bacterium]|nr:hypothetical protein [Chloroflexota bacterium]
LALVVIGLVPFAVFQFWLRAQFGTWGLTSGGALATPFEWVPFRGCWQIALLRPAVFALLATLFGPTVILPSLWGLWVAARRLLAGDFQPEVLALAAAAGVMPFLPLSTYREPVALARFACGLALPLLLFAARFRVRRVLNYALFSVVMLLMLVKG